MSFCLDSISSSDKALLETIRNYIEKELIYNYAILIDGEWGCGKTYFIKNTLIPYLEIIEKTNKTANTKKSKYNIVKKETNSDSDKKRQYLYISLYGVTDKDDVAKSIFLEAFRFKKILKSKGGKIAFGLGKVLLGGALSFKGITIPKVSLSPDDFISIKNCVFIFDDLERCSMNTNVLLGYINHLVEHEDIKTIIIANEKEIRYHNMAQDKEFKYLLATNDSIPFPKVNIDKSFGESEFGLPEPSKPELDRRVEYLFGEHDLYNKIKEKLIGKTIKYDPDMKNVIIKISNRKTYQDIKKIIDRNADFTIEKSKLYNHKNIRTIIYSFDIFQTIYQAIKDEIIDALSNKILDEIFEYTLVYAILYKSNQELPNSDDNPRDVYATHIQGKIWNSEHYIIAYKFVHDLILHSKLEIDDVITIIRQYKLTLLANNPDKNSPLYKLKNIYELEDSEFTTVYNKVLDSIKKDIYDIKIYESIIFNCIMAKSIGFSFIDIDELIRLMTINIEANNIKESPFNIGAFPYGFSDEKDDQLHQSSIKKLKLTIDNNINTNYKKEVNNLFISSENLELKLEKYIRNNQNTIFAYGSFFGLLDTSRFLDIIKSLKNVQLNHIINDIRIIYNNNYIHALQKDKSFFNSFIPLLDKYRSDIKSKNLIKANLILKTINTFKRLYDIS